MRCHPERERGTPPTSVTFSAFERSLACARDDIATLLWITAGRCPSAELFEYSIPANAPILDRSRVDRRVPGGFAFAPPSLVASRLFADRAENFQPLSWLRGTCSWGK